MHCPDELTLARWLEDVLAADERAAVDAHVDGCATCRRVLAGAVRQTFAGDSPPGSTSLLEPGTRVDHYRVGRLLGAGGMSEVYLARDTKLGRRVALKLLSPALAVDHRRRLLDEARITARFSHPHIVTIHAVGELDGRPYIALEHLDGESLRERLSDGPWGERAAARVGLAVAEALAEAHRHGVFHRDLKPENVLIPRDGRPRVVDFGLALETRDEDAERLAGGPTLGGTPAYMAPEQWRGEPCAAATDVWALGCVLHELLGGQRPYAELRGRALRQAVSGAEPVPLALPGGELDEIVCGCLAKPASERLALEAVIRGLRRLVERSVAPLEEQPFRGLQPFGAEHEGLFFGRDAEIAAALEHLRREPVLAVVGASGAGKSSFVQAGVLPRLAEDRPWLSLALRPGPRPLDALARCLLGAPRPAAWHASETGLAEAQGGPSLERLTGELRQAPRRLSLWLRRLSEVTGRPVLLSVDQLEEALTLDQTEEERQAFLEAVGSAADDGDDPLRVVLTLREDFLGRLARVPAMARALGRVVVLGSPGPAALRATLSRPVARAGYRYEDPALVDEMVEAVAEERAALPLLQFAARELWQRRDERSRALGRAAYEAMGGVSGALARHADEVVDALDDDQRRLARQLLLRLVTPEGTRRLIGVEALLAGLPAGARDVLARLIEARLVSTRRGGDERRAQQGEVELIHEALIGSWRRLARWVDGSREDRRLLDELSQAAGAWRGRGRPADELWAGARLAEASALLARDPHAPGLTRTFVEAGDVARRRARRRGRTLRLGGLALLGLVAAASLALSWIVADKERQTRAERNRARAAQALAERQRAEALLEGARAAFARQDLVEARAKLRGAFEAGDSAAARVLWWRLGHTALDWRRRLAAPVRSVAPTGDGGRVFAGSEDKAIYLLAAGSGRVTGVLRGHRRRIVALALSADGRTLVSGAWDDELRLWDLARGGGRALLAPSSGRVHHVAFAGERFASAHQDPALLWQRTAGGGARLRARLAHPAPVWAVAFSPDGQTLVTGGKDGKIRFWRASDGGLAATLAAHPREAGTLAFAPDGRRLVSADTTGKVVVWALPGRRPLRTLRYPGAVTDVRFAAGGAVIVAAGTSGVIRLWSAGRRRDLVGHAGVVQQLAVAGGYLLSASHDRTVRRWRLPPPPPLAREIGHRRPVWDIDFSPDGARLATAGHDATVRLWRAATAEQLRVLRGHRRRVSTVAFSPDGRLLASGSHDATIRLWQARDGRQRRLLLGHRSSVFRVAFAPDGETLASGSNDRTVRLWRVASGETIAVLRGHGNVVLDVAFDRAGRRLASASYDGEVLVWDVARRRRLHRFELPSAVRGVRFGRDGQALFVTADDGRLRRVDLRRGKVDALARLDGRGHRLDIDRDATRLALTSSSGLIHLRGLDARGELVQSPSPPRPLAGHRGGVNVARFSRDGRWLATGGDDGTWRLWRLGDPPLAVRPAAPALTAPALRLGATRFVAHPEGAIERVAGDGRHLTLEAPLAGPVRLLVGGPGGTLAAGYERGDVGLWDATTGKRLAHARLHGAVVALRWDGARLVARSELGSKLSWDLSVLTRERCRLLEALWARAPHVWISGAPVPRPAPASHPCRRAGRGSASETRTE